MAYRKPLFDHQQVKSVKSRTSFFEKNTTTRITTKDENNCNNNKLPDHQQQQQYGTLDSAYETGSSAYNTVDSTYKSHHHHHLACGDSPILATTNLSPQAKVRRCQQQAGEAAVGTTGGAQSNCVRNNNKSSSSEVTAEALKSPSSSRRSSSGGGKKNSIDMSYIPSYIRPVIPSPSDHLYPTSDQQQPPSGRQRQQKASKDNNNRSSQRVTATPKAESKSALREKYVKRQQELQLSGRKSLKERLQSLETDADVKLQVNISTRRRPEKKLKMPTPIVSPPPSSCSDEVVRSAPTTAQTLSGDLPVAVASCEQIKSAVVATTDIGIAEKEPTETVKSVLDDATDCHHHIAPISDDVETIANRHQDDVDKNDETTSDLIYDTQDCKVKPAAIKWKAVKKLPMPALDNVQHQQQEQEEAIRILADERQVAAAGKEENNNKLLQWKKLSPPQQVALVVGAECNDNNNNDGDIIIPVTAPATTTSANQPAANIALPLPLHTTSTSEQKTRGAEETTTTTKPPPPMRSDEKKIATRRNLVLRNNKIPALTIDIQTANSVVPVELRSPRCTTANCNNDNDRTNMREKRSARVFHLPSTAPTSEDDLDSNRDHHDHEANLNDKYPVGAGGQHVAPVKFIPSVLRRNYSQRRNRLDHEHSQSSSASSLVVACSASNSNNQLTLSPRISRRDSSHTRNKSEGMIQTPPIHSEEARMAVSKDVNRTKHQHQRRSRSVTSRSSTTRDHHHRHHHDKNNDEQTPPRNRHHHSRSRDRHDEAAFIGRIKLAGYDDEEEDEDEKKIATTPYRDRRRYDENYSASSPRSQQYVADAVKFGYPNSLNQAFGAVDGDADVESEIPFIDETATIDQQRVNLASNGDDDEDEGGDRLKQKNDRQSRKDHDERIFVKNLHQLATSPTSNMIRSTSAESILSVTNEQPGMLLTSTAATNVLLRKRSNRSFSVDRHNNKTVLRRSYISAIEKHSPPPSTSKLLSPSSTRSPARSRHFSTRRKKDSESSQQMEQSTESRKPSSPARVNRKVSTTSDVIREGYLFFKVATIDKGKRTSAQKSWKFVNALLKNHFIFLCKETKSIEACLVNEEGRGRSRRVASAYPPHQSTTSTQQQQPPQEQQQPHKYSLLEDEKPLNLIGSLVSIAYNYVKRRNVFRLTTGNGSEYLFQAKDNEDMLKWITAIQQQSGKTTDGEYNINKELILKKSSQMESTGPKPEKRNLPKKRSPKPTRHNLHAPPNKDVDGSKRFKWRGSVNKIARKFGQGNARMCGHAFGSHLEDCPSSPNNELIPFVVELCCRLVEERGLWAKGIYRVPGNTGTCNTLIEDLNQKGPDGIDVEVDTRFKEVNVISSLLKNYFRTLPDPLFTNELYKNFITTNRKPDTDDRLKGLRRLVHMLPGPHYETLKYLIQHLRRVADNAEENKMDVRNLAIVFGPTLVRTTATDNMTSMVTDMSDQCRIVESILQNVEWFFTESAIGGEDGDGGDGDRIEPVPVPTDTSQEQIIPSINHLLVNVGRTAGNKETTTGDSDSASESSKSKHSTTSEKESFSRDVINTLFGKRWKNVMMTSSSTGGGGSKKEEGEADNSSKDGDDDEFGFKQLEKRRMKKSEQQQQQQQDSNKQQQQQETGEGEAVQSSATSSPATGANSARAYRRHLSQPDDVPSTSHRHHHYSTDSVPLPQTPPISSTHKHKFHPAPPPLPINNQNRVGGGAGPGDYSSRFVVFCNEQLERFDHQQQQRHNYHPHHQPQHQIISSSSSSTTEKSSPLLPPRHYHQPHQSSHTPSTPRRQFTAAASSKPPPPPPASSSSSRTNFHYNQQTYMYGDAPQNRRFSKDPRYEHNMVPFVLVPSSSSNNQQAHQSSTIQQPASSKPQQPSTTTDNHHSDEPTPNTSVLGNGESDSETSLSMGETIEEKLKNLTNLDKKFERRPSRRLRDTSDFLTPVFTKSSATAKPKLKKLSAQSQQQLAASVSNHPQQQQQHDSKKTTLDLYQERKEMRKLQRDLVKASRSGANMARKHPLGGGSNHHRNSMIRCASEENVFNDVTRTQEAVPLPSRKSSKIRRRHTLGGSDVMDDDDNDDVGVTVTIQPPTAPNTTEMKRRRPSVTSSSSGASFRGGRKTESYL